jgi:hypothetical protein
MRRYSYRRGIFFEDLGKKLSSFAAPVALAAGNNCSFGACTL